MLFQSYVKPRTPIGFNTFPKRQNFLLRLYEIISDRKETPKLTLSTYLLTISGALYFGLPCPLVTSLLLRQKPKSAILMEIPGEWDRRMLLGFRSQWTMSAWWR